MDKILSALGQRVFVMNNVHDDRPVVFQTRWTLSYLRGPLTREQIQTLMAARKQATAGRRRRRPRRPMPTRPDRRGGGTGIAPRPPTAPAAAGARPVVPPDVPVFFVPRRARVEPGESILYRPAILGVARLHYADKKAGVDHWETLALLQPDRRRDAGGALGRERAVRRRRAGAGQGPRGRRPLRAAAAPSWPGPSATPSGPSR